MVEIHFNWSDNPYLFTLPIEEAFVKAVQVSVNSYALKTLHPVHNFLYLCMHGAKHVWSDAKWLLDIRMWQEKYGALYSPSVLCASLCLL